MKEQFFNESCGVFKRPMTAFIILAALAIFRLAVIDAYPIMDSTEARFADIARKMAASGDYLMPRYLYDEPYWGKPPLYFWVGALFYKFFGVSEVTARLPSFFFSSATVLITYLGCKKLYGATVAAFSAVVLASTALFFGLSGVVITDTALTCWVTLSLVSFIVVMQGKISDAGRGSRVWGYLFFVGLGLSLVTKGPIGVVLTLLPVFSWSIVRGRVGDFFKCFPVAVGLLIVMIMAAPWYIAAEVKTPGFLEYYFIGEHWKRFVVSGWEGSLYGGSHKFVRGTIWGFTIAGTLPWIILLAAAGVKLIRLNAGGVASACRSLIADDRAFFFFCWFVWPSIFFTMAGNILYTYVHPGLPGFAILTATAIMAVSGHDGIKGIKRPWFASSWVTLLSIAFTPIVFVVLIFTSLKDGAEWKSQKGVVEYFLADRRSPTDELVYYGKMTFSADFYSSGTAKDTPGMETERVKAELDDDNRDYFVVKNDEVESFLDKAEGRVELARKFTKYSVFIESRPTPSPVFNISK